MPLYLLRESASALVKEIERQPGMSHRPLTERLIQAYKDQHKRSTKPDDEGTPPGKTLVEAWENSLPSVIGSLHELGLDDVEVFIEFGLPHTDGDVDVLLAGVHPGSGMPSYVLIELKQQRKATVHPERSVAVDLGYSKWKLHPVRQVQKYCHYMVQYKVVLNGKPDSTAGAVLLHNAHDDDVRELFELPASNHGRLYTADRMAAFRRFLGARLAPRPGAEAAQALVDSADRPLPKITDVNQPLHGGSAHLFELLDDQELAHQDVHEAVQRVRNGGIKEVIIVRGGPGSGKSAIALELRRTLASAGLDVRHASGAKALTKTLREGHIQQAPPRMKGKFDREATKLFTYFNQLKKLSSDSCDVVICDEAHRIRRHSIDQYTSREERENPRPQADEIIEAARVPVFLLDDWQSLRPGEVGTAEYLVERARALGLKHTLIDLGGMFRAQGSAYYRDWVLRLLSVGIRTPQAWVPDGRMQVELAETAQEMEDFLSMRRFEGASTRIVAGFCWPWSKPDTNGELIPDVTLGEWRKPWNVKPGFAVEGAPDAEFWATDPRGSHQVGCVYTSQTFEFDWVGVILGPDLLWREGQFITDRTATFDPELKPKSISQVDIERCIRNAYHVLLTRGIMGVVVHSTDEETRDALRGHLITSVQHPLPSSMRKIVQH
ncbi:DNA/RNA helicase domain-containing protein [Streptomyces sp. CA-294286]|uniref:DNA/RNA helicase domain-containing protein n=1 Tax=Streptomyces sp. CA-294286 TaxID=3240070 RepID=UPI003D8F60A8